MTKTFLRGRHSGVFLPLSALPSQGPIGDLGPAAYAWLDWLVAAKQRYWQILPTSIPDSTGSPYASPSGLAGNWLLISWERLQDEGFLPADWSAPRRTAAVRYRTVFAQQWSMIREAHRVFQARATPRHRREFALFCQRERWWLDDFTLYQSLKDRHDHRPWWTWEPIWRNVRTARKQTDEKLTQRRAMHAFAQWIWSRQWQALRTYAHRHRIQIIGDLPFYVQADSVDVWSSPELFDLRADGRPRVVAGVPPDDFSAIGQRWGNPVYRWPAHRRTHWQWWIRRFRLLHERVDGIRFDHFRGLIHTWQIPLSAEDARAGKWVPSPGAEVLRAVKRRVPHLRLIAEDLGPEGMNADSLRRTFHAPTIRVEIFGWNGSPNNPHAPDAVQSDAVYYTSIHDTNTALGWWRHEARRDERQRVWGRVRRGQPLHWEWIRVAMASRAEVVMAAWPDIVGLGAVARFNRPGRKRGNWYWRSSPAMFSRSLARRLAQLTRDHGRT